jgi:hypothetical protein
VVPTEYVEPGAAAPELAGEVAVKPTVSAGGRDTGRFSAATHDDARALIQRITSQGRTAMVQPYLASVDTEGETALVFIAGRLAHVLRKRAVLAPDEVAPVRDDELGAAEAMYDPDLVLPATARPAEIELGSAVVEHLRSRFGSTPLITRTDLVGGPDGAPCVLEIEAVEPHLYLEHAPASVELLAEAIVAEASARR